MPILKKISQIAHRFFIPSELLYLIALIGKRRALLLLLTVIMLSMADLLGIAIILPYLQIVMHPERIQSMSVVAYLLHFYPELDNSALLTIMSLALCLAFLLKSLLTIGLNSYQFRQLAWLTNFLTSKVVDLALHARYALFHELPISQVAGKAYSNTVHASLFFGFSLQLFNELLFLSFFVIGLGVFYPWLALSFIVLLSVLGVLMYFGIVRKVATLGAQQAKIENEKFQLVYFISAGMRDINVMGLGGLFSRRNRIIADKHAEINWQYSLQNSLPRTVIELLMLLSFIVVVMVLNLNRSQLDVLAPILGVLAIASLRLIPSFSKLIASVNGGRFSRTFVTQLIELIAVLDKAKIYRAVDNLDFSEEIKLRNVNFKYGDKAVLTDINLSIRKKHSIGIVGASGAGKSTLLDLITGLQQVNSGAFYCDGKRFDPFKSLSIHHIVGYVPQKITLLDASVAFNITFEDEPDKQKLANAICSANLESVVESLSSGIDTLVGENGVRLSGGQCQRIGIARAIYRQPSLLVFDEATSALDNITEKELTDEIMSLGKDMAVIIVAHRLSTVMHCDYIYVMDHGRIVDVGSHNQLLQRCMLYRKMHQASLLQEDFVSKENNVQND